MYHLSVFFQTSEAVPEELMGERFGLCRVVVGKSDKANVMLHIEIRVLPGLQWRACKLFFAVGSLGGKKEVKPGDPVSKQCLKTDKTKFIGSQKKSVLQKCSDRHIKIVHDTEQACFCKNACNSTISRQVH